MTEQDKDWVEYQDNEINEAKQALQTRLDHVSSETYHGILTGELIQERQNDRLEAYLEGYADALVYSQSRIDRIKNLVKYAQEAARNESEEEHDQD